MKQKRRRAVVMVLYAAALLLLLVTMVVFSASPAMDSLSPATVALLVTSVGLVLAAGIGQSLYWRCPYCQAYFGRGLAMPRYCRSCGRPMQEEAHEQDEAAE